LAASAPLSALRRQLGEQSGVPPRRQRLLLGEKTLPESEVSLAEAGLKDGTQLSLVALPEPPPPAFEMMRINSCPKHPYSRCVCELVGPKPSPQQTHNDLRVVIPPPPKPPRTSPTTSATQQQTKKVWIQPLSDPFKQDLSPAEPGSSSHLHNGQMKALEQSTKAAKSQIRPPPPFSLPAAAGGKQAFDGQDFHTPLMPVLGFDTRQALRDSWLAQARGEYSSVLSFSLHASELTRFRAPAALLSEVLQAAQDELKHSQQCLMLASRFDPQGREFKLEGLSPERSAGVAETMQDMLTKVALEGCWAETHGTLLAARQLRSARDAQVREVLQTIVREESRHGALAWKTAAWAVALGGGSALEHFRCTIEGRLAVARSVAKPLAAGPLLPGLEEHGVIGPEAMNEVEVHEGPALVARLLAQLLEHGAAQGSEPQGFAALIAEHVNRLAGGAVL